MIWNMTMMMMVIITEGVCCKERESRG